ncbi:MAG: hypothetical protein ACRECX_05325 [Methyloceanibacter sp.]|uniref:hypothetical protein n=1 Tax=Methyloceanibacter sp. TaxID=1965321 RepID=UPI003D6D0BC5
MIKKMLLAAIAAGLVSATTLPLQTAPAEAAVMAGMSCKDAAKAQYPDDRKTRHEFKKACKDAWKASQ